MDYPGVLPYSESKALMGRDLTEDEGSVRGVAVRGLTASDFSLLDDFEGMASQSKFTVTASHLMRPTSGLYCSPSTSSFTGLVRPLAFQITEGPPFD